MIGAIEAREKYGATGKGVVIGVVDTGIDYRHPDLGGGFGPGFKVIGGYDCVDNDRDPLDENGHGTHVAGIIAANGKIKGVAPEASLMAFRVLNADGEGTYSAILAGLEKACDPDGNPATEDAVPILNLSLGGLGHEDDILCRAVDTLVSLGISCVVAAGNEGPDKQTIGSPGSSRRAITVGALHRDGRTLAAFSSRGPTTGHGMPKPDLCAPGTAIVSTVPAGGYAGFSGTSMAAPHAAGALALLMSLLPPEERYYSWQWKNYLLSAVRPSSPGAPAPEFGEIYARGKGALYLPAILPLKEQALFYQNDCPVANLGRFRPWDQEYQMIVELVIENKGDARLTAEVALRHNLPP